MKLPRAFLRLIDPAEHYMRTEGFVAKNKLSINQSLDATITASQGSNEAHRRTSDLSSAATWSQRSQSARGAATNLIAQGCAVIEFDNGTLRCEYIRFWAGDAVLKAQFVTAEGMMHTRSLTRIPAGARALSTMEKRLLWLFERILDA